MTELPDTHVQRLIGTHLSGVGRAASLQHFTFTEADGSALHLHTEIPWRLTDRSGILGGRADYWRRATSETSEADLDAGEIGATLRDVRNAALRERIAAEGPAVVSATVDRFGGLVVDFSNGMTLELFPDASSATHDDWEFWRLFQRGQPHFVVGTEGPSSRG